MTLNNPTLDALLSSPIGSKWSSNSSRGSYTQEIQQMMYGLGDYHKPLFESAQLIEEIVHQQMSSLLWQASEVAQTRSSRLIGIEHILFLMRSDKLKLSRLVKNLSVKDMRCAIKSNGFDEEDVIEAAINGTDVLNCPVEDRSTKTHQTKRVKICYDFLSSIDETGSLLVVFDENLIDNVKYERNVRNDKIASSMSQSQYSKYCEARQVSFANKARPTKFRDWLLRDTQIELKPNNFALEVLQYLAYETVAQIVDLSLLVKQDNERDVCDPLTSLLPNKVTNDDFPINQCEPKQTTDNNEEFNINQTANFFLSPQSKSKNVLLNSQLDSQKNKKRKREAHTSLECAHSYCITPNHIREAMRRYFTASGPFVNSRKPFHKYSSKNKRLLCI